ncbi:unnamed protein product [Cyclocybe aegerita]|uniref:F-box domain-containing protein n=1 Tax=Cyclocybe aegerita TaxID=1973307 RepID=A0A8S0W386_CYCAE|nr:unnamed protein product [Cyclocybe aegerita]
MPPPGDPLRTIPRPEPDQSDWRWRDQIASVVSKPTPRPWYTNPASQAVVLASVSQVWRQVAISTQSLWSTISVNVGCTPWNGDVETYAKVTGDWLNRSGQLPIALWTHEGLRETDVLSGKGSEKEIQTQPDISVVPLFEVLNAHLGRAERLEICIPKKYFPYLNTNVDALVTRELEISIADAKEPHSSPFAPTNTLISPQRLVLERVPPHLVKIAWMPARVVDCKITCIYKHFGQISTPPTGVITLPSLKTLVLDPTHYETNLVRCLTLPALETLESRSKFSAITDMIRRSQCKVRHLVLDGDEWYPNEIHPLLQETPYLLELHVTKVCITAALGEHLATTAITTDPRKEFLPRLRVFDVHAELEESFEWASILALFPLMTEGDGLSGSRRPLSTLHLICVTICTEEYDPDEDERIERDISPPPMQKQVMKRLRELRDSGIDISIENDHWDLLEPPRWLSSSDELESE